MPLTVEFYFDLSSPWTCLAFHNIQPIIKDNGAEIIWKPFLVGGVFNAVNQDVYAARENPDNRKFVHSFRVLKDWAKLAGLPMNFPSEHHPVKSVHAMRVCCALEDDQAALHKFATAAFNAYYGEQRNLDDPQVLIAIANEGGLDGAALQKHRSKRSRTGCAPIQRRRLPAVLMARRAYLYPLARAKECISAMTSCRWLTGRLNRVQYNIESPFPFVSSAVETKWEYQASRLRSKRTEKSKG